MSLSENGLLVPDRIAAAHLSAQALISALQETSDPAERAALAILCARDQVQAAIPLLAPLLQEEELLGRAAAWSLAQLGAEDALCAATAGSGLDQREHAYLGLAVLVAQGGASPSLADLMLRAVHEEINRASSGRTGLGEQPCRILAMLGDSRCAELIALLIEKDPLTDRFELQRLRKALENEGRDHQSLADYGSSWQEFFADFLAPLKEEEQPDRASDEETIPEEAEELPDSSEEGEGEEEAAVLPLDVAAYLAEQDADDKVQSLVGQIVPMLQQVSQQAIGSPLEQLQAQEFAALLLQVLPQALPPQYLQALFSPQTINALAACFKWYQQRSGNGALAEGIQILRQQLQAQMRASGMLGGPDFSDPDEQAEDLN